MKIFVSRSAEADANAQKYIDELRSAGASVAGGGSSGNASGSTAELLSSDGILFVIAGSDHANLKADLNLALDNKKPVACVIEEGAWLDKGLEMQLGLAEKIAPDSSAAQIKAWLFGLEKENKGRRLKRALIAVIVIAVIAIAAVFGMNAAKSRQAEAARLAEEARIAEEQAAAEAAAKDPRNLYFEGKDPAGFTVLDLSGRGIEDISFISEAVNLTELNLSGNSISDITPLAALEKLEKLDLSNNAITDINALLSLKSLKELNLSGNNITDTGALDFMKGVKVSK